MRSVCCAVSIATLFSVAGGRAQTQGHDSLSAAQHTSAAFEVLRIGQKVRIHSRGAGLVEGWVLSSSPDLVRLGTGDQSMVEVPAPGVDSLWVRAGSHAGSGALIGALVGGIGLGGLTAAATIGQRCFEQPCPAGALVTVGLAVGSAGGALIGALIGAPIPRWQLRVP